MLRYDSDELETTSKNESRSCPYRGCGEGRILQYQERDVQLSAFRPPRASAVAGYRARDNASGFRATETAAHAFAHNGIEPPRACFSKINEWPNDEVVWFGSYVINTVVGERPSGTYCPAHFDRLDLGPQLKNAGGAWGSQSFRVLLSVVLATIFRVRSTFSHSATVNE